MMPNFSLPFRDINLSESEAEQDGSHNITELPQAYAGRGNMKAQQSAVRLTEVSQGRILYFGGGSGRDRADLAMMQMIWFTSNGRATGSAIVTSQMQEEPQLLPYLTPFLCGPFKHKGSV